MNGNSNSMGPLPKSLNLSLTRRKDRDMFHHMLQRKWKNCSDEQLAHQVHRATSMGQAKICAFLDDSSRVISLETRTGHLDLLQVDSKIDKTSQTESEKDLSRPMNMIGSMRVGSSEEEEESDKFLLFTSLRGLQRGEKFVAGTHVGNLYIYDTEYRHKGELQRTRCSKERWWYSKATREGTMVQPLKQLSTSSRSRDEHTFGSGYLARKPLLRYKRSTRHNLQKEYQNAVSQQTSIDCEDEILVKTQLCNWTNPHAFNNTESGKPLLWDFWETGGGSFTALHFYPLEEYIGLTLMDSRQYQTAVCLPLSCRNTPVDPADPIRWPERACFISECMVATLSGSEVSIWDVRSTGGRPAVTLPSFPRDVGVGWDSPIMTTPYMTGLCSRNPGPDIDMVRCGRRLVVCKTVYSNQVTCGVQFWAVDPSFPHKPRLVEHSWNQGMDYPPSVAIGDRKDLPLVATLASDLEDASNVLFVDRLLGTYDDESGSLTRQGVVSSLDTRNRKRHRDDQLNDSRSENGVVLDSIVDRFGLPSAANSLQFNSTGSCLLTASVDGDIHVLQIC